MLAHFTFSGIFISVPAGQGGKKGSSLTLSDRVSVYLELAAAHSQLNHEVGEPANIITRDLLVRLLYPSFCEKI